MCVKESAAQILDIIHRGECSGVAETCWVSGFVGNEKKDIKYI